MTDNDLALFNDLLTLISSLEKTNDRKKIKSLLHAILVNIFENFKRNEKDRESLAIFDVLTKHMITTIHTDFMQTKNRDLIDLLVDFQISPLSREEIDYFMLEHQEEQKLHPLTNLQTSWRSRVRERLHFSIFGKNPATISSLCNSVSTKLKIAITELTGYHSIIDSHIHHWTTIDNLKSIIQCKAFFGHTILKNKGIQFAGNAYSDCDNNNGDGKIICFCPYLIDPCALLRITKDDIKDHLVRLTIDVNQISNREKYNQFFKLRDLCSPGFLYEATINDKFNVTFLSASKGTTKVTLKYDNLESSVEIEKADHIFYGNLSEINKFCLTQFINVLQKVTPQFRNQFYWYLATLNVDEIKKILIIFSQGLTVYSEYNFNGCLPLTDNLIDEVYIAKTNTSFNLKNLTLDNYNENLAGIIKDKWLASSKTLPKAYVEVLGSLLVYGQVVEHSGHINLREDFSKIPADVFSNTFYIETRPGSNKQLFDGSFENHNKLTLHSV